MSRSRICRAASCAALPLRSLPDEAAVGEALTNAGKHAGSQRLTVFVEADDGGGVFCSVKDDGAGFDAVGVTEGVGLSRSIRGRLAEVGGRVEVDSRPGSGTEVRLWIPI